MSIFSADSQEVADLADQLVNYISRVNLVAQGQCGLNTLPFTSRKNPAEGTRPVHHALRSFSIRTVVATRVTDANKHLLNELVDGQESSLLSTRFILQSTTLSCFTAFGTTAPPLPTPLPPRPAPKLLPARAGPAVVSR